MGKKTSEKPLENNISSFVERYQLLYEKDPNSKVFAPLAEAYRRMGLVDEAIDLAEKGVKRHPHFASGRVALGKCYVQKSQFEKALEQLKVAVDLSPENLLAHQLLAECYARLKMPAEALNAYKLVLFLNPGDGRVAQIVKKLEKDLFVPPEDEVDSEDFSMEQIKSVQEKTSPRKADEKKIDEDRDFERELALLDTRFDRGDWGAAQKQVDDLLKKHPGHPELLRRKAYMEELSQHTFNMFELLEPIKTDLKQPKIDKLRMLLERLETRRKA